MSVTLTSHLPHPVSGSSHIPPPTSISESRFPSSARDFRYEPGQRRRLVPYRLPLLSTLVRGHEQTNHVDAIGKRQSRLLFPEERAHVVAILVRVAVGQPFLRHHRHYPNFSILLLDEILAGSSLHGPAEEELQAAVE